MTPRSLRAFVVLHSLWFRCLTLTEVSVTRERAVPRIPSASGRSRTAPPLLTCSQFFAISFLSLAFWPSHQVFSDFLYFRFSHPGSVRPTSPPITANYYDVSVRTPVTLADQPEVQNRAWPFIPLCFLSSFFVIRLCRIVSSLGRLKLGLFFLGF